MPAYTPQQTLQYSTFVKRALVTSLEAAFLNHPSPTIARTRVALDFSHERWQLPGIIIRFYERDLPNAGVGHVEYLPSPQDDNPDNPTLWIKYYHRYYHGDISFEIYGQSTVDRDLVRDGLVEVLTTWDATPAGNTFLTNFYGTIMNTPYGSWHYPVLMLDQLTGYGEQQTIAAWRPEDMLVYQATYRLPIFGEFYSNTPWLPSSNKILTEVDVYPWIVGQDPPPEQADADDWYRFTGWTSVTKVI